MFRVKESAPPNGFSVAEWVVRVTLWSALAANVVSAYLIFQEHRRLTAWLDAPEPMAASDLTPLRREVTIQFASSFTVSIILVFSLAATWWLRRRYVSSQRALRQVKMLAHDILASGWLRRASFPRSSARVPPCATCFIRSARSPTRT